MMYHKKSSSESQTAGNKSFLKDKIKIFYFMPGYKKKNSKFSIYIKAKYTIINKTYAIDTEGQEKHVVNIILDQVITKDDFNNIINTIIEYHNDENIIFFYKSGKEEPNKKYTFSNIVKVRNKQAMNEDPFRSDSDDN